MTYPQQEDGARPGPPHSPPPGRYGPPHSPPPKKTLPLAWMFGGAGAIVVVIGAVVALVLVLDRDQRRSADPQAGASSAPAPSSSSGAPARSDLGEKPNDELMTALAPKSDFPEGWHVTEIGPDERASAAAGADADFGRLGYSPEPCKDAFVALLNFGGAWISHEMHGELVGALVAMDPSGKNTSGGVGIFKNLDPSDLDKLKPLLSTCSSFTITGSPRGDVAAAVSPVRLNGAPADEVLGLTLRLENQALNSTIVAKVRGVYVVAVCAGDLEGLNVKLVSATVNNLNTM